VLQLAYGQKMEHIAYQGAHFRIEWYFDSNQKSQALDHYQHLGTNDRIKLLKLIKRMGDAGKINDKTKFVNEGEKIYAFKPQPERFLCFFYEGKKIIITNAFQKKQQKLPVGEKNKALKCRQDYINRVTKGDYYERD